MLITVMTIQVRAIPMHMTGRSQMMEVPRLLPIEVLLALCNPAIRSLTHKGIMNGGK
jgi:hypothetical protein